MAFGDAPVALRSMWVVTSVTAKGLMIAAGTEACGPAAGLCAGLLMAVAVPQLREARDARAYMPVTLGCTAALVAVQRTDRRGPNRWRVAGLFLALLALPLLHYMALATVGAVAIYGTIGMRGPARWATLLATACAVAVFAAIWGPQLIAQHQRMLDGRRWLVESAAGGVGRTVAELLSAPVRLLINAKPAAAVAGGCAC